MSSHLFQSEWYSDVFWQRSRQVREYRTCDDSCLKSCIFHFLPDKRENIYVWIYENRVKAFASYPGVLFFSKIDDIKIEGDVNNFFFFHSFIVQLLLVYFLYRLFSLLHEFEVAFRSCEIKVRMVDLSKLFGHCFYKSSHTYFSK